MPTRATKIIKESGVAGQIAYHATYLDQFGNESKLTLFGSQYGAPGPVILQVGKIQTFVSQSGRFGHQFDRQWVRRFVSGQEVA